MMQNSNKFAIISSMLELVVLQYSFLKFRYHVKVNRTRKGSPENLGEGNALSMGGKTCQGLVKRKSVHTFLTYSLLEGFSLKIF